MTTASANKMKLPVAPEELEFFAEEEPITIIPSFQLRHNTSGMLSCVGGDYGPFRPNMPVEVPIWLALQLHKRGKCRILPPAWLDAARLQALITAEQSDVDSFQEVPFYFMEVCCLLFESAKDAFGDSFFKVRDLLQRFVNIRRHKIEEGLRLVSQASTIRLTNLSAYEANLIRLNLQGSLNMFLKFSKVELMLESRAASMPTMPTPGF
ncbi:DNA replication complex GINS [Raphidocelis subcapitata]|uniref:DNA replication complex GINS protein PSF2 n=1 Tax=Raphidocelis subcapitata TaxID=307507 RepID=A0A2V0PG03_9CHLO|nr:DNA replication complex GINS [Raphidocelis subcapitata]|eukprot:GBF97942.1 DNA replication complex GINS [Raphidocelis subcapitata]